MEYAASRPESQERENRLDLGKYGKMQKIAGKALTVSGFPLGCASRSRGQPSGQHELQRGSSQVKNEAEKTFGKRVDLKAQTAKIHAPQRGERLFRNASSKEEKISEKPLAKTKRGAKLTIPPTKSAKNGASHTGRNKRRW